MKCVKCEKDIKNIDDCIIFNREEEDMDEEYLCRDHIDNGKCIICNDEIEGSHYDIIFDMKTCTLHFDSKDLEYQKRYRDQIFFILCKIKQYAKHLKIKKEDKERTERENLKTFINYLTNVKTKQELFKIIEEYKNKNE